MSFTCPRCGKTSHHPMDEDYGYCGNCHDFTGIALDSELQGLFDKLMKSPIGKLPCDVMLPPATIIRQGCSLDVLMKAVRVREGRPRDDTEFKPHVVNHFETTDAGVIDWKMEAERANRLYAELLGVFNFRRDADQRAAQRWREATGNELKWPDQVDLVLFLLQQLEIDERLDRTDTALAGRVGTMIEQQSALMVWLTDWLRHYSTDIFPEPDLAKAAEVLKASDMTLDSLSAQMGRHVLGRVLAFLANPPPMSD